MVRLLDEKQAAEYLCLSRSWLQKARCHGYGPAYVRLRKDGGIRYRLTDLERWLERNSHGGKEVL
jgi:hypothetical protein